MPRALVVDDDPDQLLIMAKFLPRLGLDVVTASSGDGLLERIAELDPGDVVITDISMPSMTGVQALVRARAAGHTNPVIVTTAMRGPALEADVAALSSAGTGTAVLLYKPFSMATLYATVEGAMRR